MLFVHFFLKLLYFLINLFNLIVEHYLNFLFIHVPKQLLVKCVFFSFMRPTQLFDLLYLPMKRYRILGIFITFRLITSSNTVSKLVSFGIIFNRLELANRNRSRSVFAVNLNNLRQRIPKRTHNRHLSYYLIFIYLSLFIPFFDLKFLIWRGVH